MKLNTSTPKRIDLGSIREIGVFDGCLI